MNQFIALLGLFLLLTPSVQAKSSVWKIEKNGQTAFIAGTIHILRPNDIIPKEYDIAFNAAEKVVFETDISQLKSTAVQLKMLSLMTYKNGDSLKSKLSPEVYTELAAFLKTMGLPIKRLNRFKPGMLSVTLIGLMVQKYGYSAEGIDAIYHSKAIKHGKAIGQLESIDKQLMVISTMGDGEEDAFIRNLMSDMKEAKPTLDNMIDVLKKGDLKTLEKELLEPIKTLPKLYKSLIVDRNNHWMPQIQAMLKTKEKELIMVGALHLVGHDGLLEQLKRKNFKVIQL